MSAGPDNLGFIECWNQILTPKWVRFRHLLSGNGAIHSGLAADLFGISAAERVLDIGCGFGETCLDSAQRVGSGGEVLGVDCTEAFLEIARSEAVAAGAANVRYLLADAQDCEFAAGHYDVAYSRFGVMFFQSAVRAMRNMSRALKPGGRMCLIVWRALRENPCWAAGREIALRYLSPPGDAAKTCGPGPFSMADEQTTRDMLKAAGFADVVFRRQDTDICVGRTVEEAIDYQILVGPSGEIIREAGDEGRRRLPEIRADLEALLVAHRRADGVWMPSSTWAVVGRKQR